MPTHLRCSWPKIIHEINVFFSLFRYRCFSSLPEHEEGTFTFRSLLSSITSVILLFRIMEKLPWPSDSTMEINSSPQRFCNVQMEIFIGKCISRFFSLFYSAMFLLSVTSPIYLFLSLDYILSFRIFFHHPRTLLLGFILEVGGPRG